MEPTSPQPSTPNQTHQKIEVKQQDLPPPPLNVVRKLLAIRADLHYVQKGEKTVNGKYRFVSHDQVARIIHPHLLKHGLLPLPSMAGLRQDGNRTVVDLNVWWSDVDVDSSWLTKWSAYGIDAGDKGVGAATSYAFKYACLKTLGLETGDDPDYNAGSVYEPAKCLEFELQLPPGMNKRDHDKMNAFLVHSAQVMKTTVEEVKREAATRFDGFMIGFKKWSDKKKVET